MYSKKSARAYSFSNRNAILGCWYISIYLIIFTLFSSIFNLFNPLLVAANEVKLDSHAATSSKHDLIPIGIMIGDQLVESSVLIRGSLDHSSNISDWLIPLDTVLTTLKFKLTKLNNGQLQLQSPGLVTRLQPNLITNDPELGQVISLKKVENILKVPVKFDQQEFTLIFNPAWNNLTNFNPEESPIILDGLPVIATPKFAIGGVQLQTILSDNRSDGYLKTQGSIRAVGTALEGSWFVGLDQDNFNNFKSWQLEELQYFRQNGRTDYLLGLQATFWQGGGGFWGISTIQRWGFDSYNTLDFNSYNIDSRLQPKYITRTITGKAQAGTFVRIVKNQGDRIIAEQLVDDSGIYKFKNLVLENSLSNYQALLYAHGQLTIKPKIRQLGKNNLRGILAPDTQALVTAIGWQANDTSSNSFRAGFAYRQGMTQNLTLGTGLVYDESLLALAQIFYQPSQIPVQIGFSLLSNFDKRVDISSIVKIQPSSNVQLNLITNPSDQYFLFNWDIPNNFAFIAKGSLQHSNLEAGIQYSSYNRNFSIFTQLIIDTDQILRWNIYADLANWEFKQIGQGANITSAINYSFSSQRLQSLLLEHSTSNTDWLTTFQWSYRSNYNNADRGFGWQFDLGYGIGSQGRGIVTAVSTSLLPGIDLRGRYQQISLTSDNSDFRLELIPHFSPQTRLPLDSRGFNGLRRYGGIKIQPFLDHNQNQLRDRDEPIILEESELLLTINNQPLRNFPYRTVADGIVIPL